MTFGTKYNHKQQYTNKHHPSLVWRSCLLLLVVSLLVGSFSNNNGRVRFVGASDVTPVSCVVAYSRDAKPVQLSVDQMNDGYCDCIWDGTDEPLTTACAGYGSWPGTTLLDATTQKETSVKSSFQCPEEAKLQISLSKLSDGICDCCDGADENVGDNKVCNDQCAEIRAANAAAKAILIDKFTTGSAKRQQALNEYNNFVTNVKNEIQQYRTKVGEANQVIETIQTKIKTLKTNFTPLRMETYIHFMSYPTTETAVLLKQLFNVFQLNELQWLLVYICQLSGEIFGSSDIKTCVPLRLAGLDVGITWEPNTYKLNLFNPKDKTQVDAFVSYANILSYNIDQTDVTKRVWNAKMIPKSNNNSNDNNTKPKNRRLQEDNYDDEDDYKDDEDDFDDDDHDHADYSSYNSQREKEQEEAAAAAKAKLALMDDISDTTNKDELLQKIHQLSLSQKRIQFTTEANRILNELDEIEKALDEASKEDSDDDKPKDGNEEGASTLSSEGDSAATTNESEPTKPSIDPMALTMIRNTLNDRIKVIDSGYNFAVSSLVLIDAIFDYYNTGDGNDRVKEKQQLLSELIIGTIYHGQISTLHLHELFQHVLPELRSSDNGKNDKETCKSPWADVCGEPKFVKRDGVTIPPMHFEDPITTFCVDKFMQHQQQQEASGGVCLSSQPITTDNIPSDIPDGYFGYSVVKARDEYDMFNYIIHEALLRGDQEFKKELTALENDLTNAENDQRFMLEKIDEFNNAIGGQDESKNTYGPNGELHAIRDSCFDIQAGKYVYETCLFKGAKQRDADADKSSHGTSLGRWKGYSNESNTGRRVWEWTDGDKCWNGPHRSATVYVTCGKDNVLLTAEEPDTCRYVFEMESPVACDDEFRVQNDL